MIKIIKFDLPLDGSKIKSLEELRENFSAEILGHCRSGLLLRWLRSRGLTEQAAALDGLDTSQYESLFRGLCKIFEVESDELILSAMFDTTQAAPASTSAKRVAATYGQMIAEIDAALENVIRDRAPKPGVTNPDIELEVQRKHRLAYLRGLEREISSPLVKGLMKQRADELETTIHARYQESELAKARAIAMAFRAISEHFSLQPPSAKA